jgi:hypothetical protein
MVVGVGDRDGGKGDEPVAQGEVVGVVTGSEAELEGNRRADSDPCLGRQGSEGCCDNGFR